MNKNIMLLLIGIFILTFLVHNVNAVNFYGQNYFLSDNHTLESRYYVVNDLEVKIKNQLSDGKPYEFYYIYSSYIDSWNLANVNNRVAFCNFSVKFLVGNSSQNVYVFSDYLTSDTAVKKYFVQLNPKDAVISYMDCYFEGQRPNEFIFPATMEIKAPTWECKACQLYEWSQNAPVLYKSSSLLNARDETLRFITSFLTMIYEDIIILFWVLLIVTLLFSISLIFVGIYWLYLYVRRLV